MSKIVSALEDFTAYWYFNNYLYGQLYRMYSGLRKDKSAISALGHQTCFRIEVTFELADSVLHIDQGMKCIPGTKNGEYEGAELDHICVGKSARRQHRHKNEHRVAVTVNWHLPPSGCVIWGTLVTLHHPLILYKPC